MGPRCRGCNQPLIKSSSDHIYGVIGIYLLLTINEMTNICYHKDNSSTRGPPHLDGLQSASPTDQCIDAIRILSAPSMPRLCWQRLLSLQLWSGSPDYALLIVRLCKPDRSIVDFVLYLLVVSEGLQTKPRNAISDRGCLVAHDRSMVEVHACRGDRTLTIGVHRKRQSSATLFHTATNSLNPVGKVHS